MSRDVLITARVVSANEGKAVLAAFREKAVAGNYIISQATLVKRVSGRTVTIESFDSGAKTSNDTLFGGVVGGIVGLAAGPVGALVAGGLGALAGSVKDDEDEWKGSGVLAYAASRLRDGELAVITIAREDEENALDVIFRRYDALVYREDVSKVDEVLRAEEKKAVKKDLTT